MICVVGSNWNELALDFVGDMFLTKAPSSTMDEIT